MQRQSPASTRCSGVHPPPRSGSRAAERAAGRPVAVERDVVRERAGPGAHVDLASRIPSGPSHTVLSVQRLRPLSEEECYLRCYGWRGSEDTVKVVPSGHPPISESPGGTDRADPARVRGAPRGARARSRIDGARPHRRRFPTCSLPGSRSSSAGSTPAASRTRRRPTSPIRATTSGASSTRQGSRRACSTRRSSSTCSRSGSASRTRPTGRPPARATCAQPTSREAPSGSRRSRASCDPA